MLLGTAVFFFVEREVNRGGGGESRENSADEQGGSTAAIAIGALLDGIPESAAIGISLIEGGIGIALVGAVFLSNVPEGLPSAAGMKRAGLAPRPTCSASGAPSRWPRPSPR